MIECIVRTDDVMAEVRVLEALRADGLPARAATADEWAREMAAVPIDLDEPASPTTVGIVDLTVRDAVAAIEQAAEAGVPVIAYGPHVDGDAMAAARAAGATVVYPRGRFLMQTAELVRALTPGAEGDGKPPEDAA